MSGKYPNGFFRATTMAFIRNAEGKILVVQEKNGKWNLPGGGIDHGETPLECLKRELSEELGINDDFKAQFVGIDSYFYEPKDAWLLWIMYELKFEYGYTYAATNEVDSVKFLDPSYFKDSEYAHQKLIYKWAVEKSPL